MEVFFSIIAGIFAIIASVFGVSNRIRNSRPGAGSGIRNDRTIKDNADVEFAHRQLRSIGDVFMVASGLSKPTFKSYIKSKWQQFKARTDKWQWWKWYLFFLGILSIIIMHQEYQN